MATERIIRCRKSISLSDAAALSDAGTPSKRLEFQDKKGTWFVCTGGHEGDEHDWPQEPEGGLPAGS
jgi:hypothetical protein